MMGTAPISMPAEPLSTLSVLLELIALIQSVMPIDQTIASALADIEQRDPGHPALLLRRS
jgi:hypothetical protein